MADIETELGTANKSLIRSITQAAWNGELEVFDHHPGYWQTRKVFPLILSAFRQVGAARFDQIAEGNHVFSLTSVRVMHHGPMIDVAPTGKEVVLNNAALDEVQEGTVTQHNGASGWPDVLRRLGASAPVRLARTA